MTSGSISTWPSPEEDLLDVCSPVRGQVPGEKECTNKIVVLCRRLENMWGSQCGGEADGLALVVSYCCGLFSGKLHEPAGSLCNALARAYLSEWCTMGKVSDRGLCQQKLLPNETELNQPSPRF